MWLVRAARHVDTISALSSPRWFATCQCWRTREANSQSVDRRFVSTRPYARWTPAEDEKLLNLRSEGHFREEIAAHFPNRSLAAVRTRIDHLLKRRPDMPRRVPIPMTAAEQQLLVSLEAQGLKWSDIATRFPGRSRFSLHRIWHHLNGKAAACKSGPFTPAEDERLLELVDSREPTLTWLEVAHALGRTLLSVNSRYCKLRPQVLRRRKPHSHALSDVERAQALEMRAQGRTYREIAAALSRNPMTIYKLVRNITQRSSVRDQQQPRFYTETEDNKLLRLKEQGLSWDEIQRSLGSTRSVNALLMRWFYLERLKRDGVAPVYLATTAKPSASSASENKV